MHALVTNDDGIDSPGLGALARVAVEAGLDVVAAAPAEEFSGASASLSALEADGRLRTHPRSLEGLAAVRALGVEASPAFITFAAVHEAFGPPPGIVLSGINHGPNVGQAVLHSGTIGATLTARTHGIPSLALSCTSSAPRYLNTCAEVAARVLAWLLERPGDEAIALSVNVPDVPPDELRGLRSARLASFGAVQAEVGEIGEDHVTMTIRETEDELEPGTDAALVADGWATVTSLAAPCEVHDVDITGLADIT